MVLTGHPRVPKAAVTSTIELSLSKDPVKIIRYVEPCPELALSTVRLTGTVRLCRVDNNVAGVHVNTAAMITCFRGRIASRDES